MKKFGKIKDKGGLLKGLMLFLAVLFIGQTEAFAQYGEIDALIKNERYEEAMSKAKTMLAEEPKDEKLEYRIGRIHFLRGEMGPAGASFRSGVSHGNRYPMNHVGLGAVAAVTGSFPDASAHLTKALDVDKAKSTQTMLGVADAYLSFPGSVQDGNEFYKSAEGQLLLVTQRDPNSAPGYVKLGELYDKKGIEELAQTYFEKAIGFQPNYVNGHLRLGQLKKKQDKYNEAADHFQKAIELDPNFAPPLKEMAEMWFKAKQYDKATDFYNRYLAMMGDDSEAKKRLGFFQYLGEQYDEAIKTLLPLVEGDEDIRIRRILAYCFVKKENPEPEKALEWFDKFFAKAKSEFILPADFQNKGLALMQKGDDSTAIKVYEDAIAYAEDKGEPIPELLMDIAGVFKDKKNYAMQAEYISRYLATQNRYKLKESFALGRAYYSAKNYPMSDSIFGLMAENKPDLYIGHLWQARSRSLMDPDSKEGLAKPSYERLLEIYSADEELKAKYQKDFVEASRYMGAFHTLVDQDFQAAVPYWEAILAINPEDQGAAEGLKFCKSQNGG